MEQFFAPPAAGNLRGHNFMVRQPRFHLARRKAVFAVRSAGPWNRLHPQIAETPTVSSFKDLLEATGAPSTLTLFDPTPLIVLM